MAVQTLADIMKVDFVFNDDGGVWLLHDKPLPAGLDWTEYDAQEGTVTLVTTGGDTIGLGLSVPARMGRKMCTAKTLVTLHVTGPGKYTAGKMPIIIRNVSVN